MNEYGFDKYIKIFNSMYVFWANNEGRDLPTNQSVRIFRAIRPVNLGDCQVTARGLAWLVGRSLVKLKIE